MKIKACENESKMWKVLWFIGRCKNMYHDSVDLFSCLIATKKSMRQLNATFNQQWINFSSSFPAVHLNSWNQRKMKDFHLIKMYMLLISTHMTYAKSLKQPFNKRNASLIPSSQFAGNLSFMAWTISKAVLLCSKDKKNFYLNFHYHW